MMPQVPEYPWRFPVVPNRTCAHEVECWKRAATEYIVARLDDHFRDGGCKAQLDSTDGLRRIVKDRTLDGLARSYLQEFCRNTYDFADPSWEILFELHPHDSHRLLLTLE